LYSFVVVFIQSSAAILLISLLKKCQPVIGGISVIKQGFHFVEAENKIPRMSGKELLSA
jgi:hypothetical protein